MRIRPVLKLTWKLLKAVLQRQHARSAYLRYLLLQILRRQA